MSLLTDGVALYRHAGCLGRKYEAFVGDVDNVRNSLTSVDLNDAISSFQCFLD
jgi:hypothetical protein